MSEAFLFVSPNSVNCCRGVDRCQLIQNGIIEHKAIDVDPTEMKLVDLK